MTLKCIGGAFGLIVFRIFRTTAELCQPMKFNVLTDFIFGVDAKNGENDAANDKVEDYIRDPFECTIDTCGICDSFKSAHVRTLKGARKNGIDRNGALTCDRRAKKTKFFVDCVDRFAEINQLQMAFSIWPHQLHKFLEFCLVQ